MNNIKTRGDDGIVPDREALRADVIAARQKRQTV
jgi:hypothetical protein